MTNQSVQKLLTFLLFLWSCTLVWATTTLPSELLYIGGEVLTEGEEHIYVPDLTRNSLHHTTTNKAVVYILPNTVFSESLGADLNAALVYEHQTSLKKNKFNTNITSKKGNNACQVTLYEQKIPLPFDQAPASRMQLFINLVTVLDKSTKSEVVNNTKSLGLIIADYLQLQVHQNTATFSEPKLVLFSTHGKAYYATRPPPTFL